MYTALKEVYIPVKVSSIGRGFHAAFFLSFGIQWKWFQKGPFLGCSETFSSLKKKNLKKSSMRTTPYTTKVHLYDNFYR